MKEIHRCKHYDLIHDGNDYVCNQVVNSGGNLFDDFLKQVFDAAIGPNSVVIEVGAHVGTHTCYISKLAGQVYALEPQRYLFLNLCANLFLNDCMNVTPLPVACGNTVGFLKANIERQEYLNTQGKASISFSPSLDKNDFLRVSCIRLDDMFSHVDFLKIDVEGMDWQVAQGAMNLIKKCRPTIVFEDNNKDVAKWSETLNPLGYCIELMAEGNYCAGFKKNS